MNIFYFWKFKTDRSSELQLDVALPYFQTSENVNLDGSVIAIGDRRSDSPRKYDHGFDLDPYFFDDDSTILTSSSSPTSSSSSSTRTSPTFVPVGPAIPGRDIASGRDLGSGRDDDDDGPGEDRIAFGFGTNEILSDNEGTVAFENPSLEGSVDSFVEDIFSQGENPQNPVGDTKSDDEYAKVGARTDEGEGAFGQFDGDNDDSEIEDGETEYSGDNDLAAVFSESPMPPPNGVGILQNDGESPEQLEERSAVPQGISQDTTDVMMDIEDSKGQVDESETSETLNGASDYNSNSIPILFGLFGDYPNDIGDDERPTQSDIQSETDPFTRRIPQKEEESVVEMNDNEVIYDTDDLSPKPIVEPDSIAKNPQDGTNDSEDDKILFGLLDDDSTGEEPFRSDIPLAAVLSSTSMPSNTGVGTQDEGNPQEELGAEGVLFGLFDIPVSSPVVEIPLLRPVESNSNDDEGDGNVIEDLPLPDISDDTASALFGLFDLIVDDAFRDEVSVDANAVDADEEENEVKVEEPGGVFSSAEGRAIDQTIAKEELSGVDTNIVLGGQKFPNANVEDEILFGIYEYDPPNASESEQGDVDFSSRTSLNNPDVEVQEEKEGNEILFGLFDAPPPSKPLLESGDEGDLPIPDIPGQTRSVPEATLQDFLDLLGVGSESEEDEDVDSFDLLEEEDEDERGVGDERASDQQYANEITLSTAYSLPIAALFDEDDRGSLDEGIDGDAAPDDIFNLLASFGGNPSETQDQG